MLNKRVARRRLCGFTIIELMVAVAVLAILVMAAAPAMQQWIVNTRVRSTAEALQNGLRQAQAEAVRRSRQVVFALTNNDPALDVAPTVDGRNWSAQTVPGLTDAAAEFIRGGRLVGQTAGVTIDATPNSARSICFNSIGALATNAAPAPAQAAYVCTASTAVPEIVYVVAHPGSDRPLQVRVTNGGRIRMCDPARAVATSSDGC